MKETTEPIPLKTILQNFLNHVETLETKKNEGEDLYEKEFQVNNNFFTILCKLRCCKRESMLFLVQMQQLSIPEIYTNLLI